MVALGHAGPGGCSSHALEHLGSPALRHMGSCRTWDQTHAPALAGGLPVPPLGVEGERAMHVGVTGHLRPRGVGQGDAQHPLTALRPRTGMAR